MKKDTRKIFENNFHFHFLKLSLLWGPPQDKGGEDILKVPSCSVTLMFTLLDERSFMQMMGNSQASASSTLLCISTVTIVDYKILLNLFRCHLCAEVGAAITWRRDSLER